MKRRPVLGGSRELTACHPVRDCGCMSLLPGIFCLSVRVHPDTEKMFVCLSPWTNQPGPEAHRTWDKLPRKRILRKMGEMKNGIMLSFRGTSCPRSGLMRERSLLRVQQLPSFLYLTWLSLPFSVISR